MLTVSVEITNDVYESLLDESAKSNLSVEDLLRQFIKQGLVKVETNDNVSILQQKLNEVEERSKHHPGQDFYNI